MDIESVHSILSRHYLSGLGAGNLTQAQQMAEADMKEAESQGIRIVRCGEEGYPRLLQEIPDPPPIIYRQGQGDDLDVQTIALVGSRRCSYYGQKVARDLAQGFAMAGVITVSGLARGIDSIIHKETLACGGATWAVLGSGLLEIYPPENRALAKKICDKGLLLSEFPLHMMPLRGNFPRRNRIISGLSLGCVMIEGDEKSGALITCRLAAEQGREVFAVPGSINSPLSRGPHRLIKNGAKLVESIDDIVEEIEALRGNFSDQKKESSEKNHLHSNEIYESILYFVREEPIHKDNLVKLLRSSAADLAPKLLDLELRGLIKNLPGGFVVRK